jgi:hypothetical protein
MRSSSGFECVAGVVKRPVAQDSEQDVEAVAGQDQPGLAVGLPSDRSRAVALRRDRSRWR